MNKGGGCDADEYGGSYRNWNGSPPRKVYGNGDIDPFFSSGPLTKPKLMLEKKEPGSGKKADEKKE